MTLKQNRPKEQEWKATLMETVKEENFLRPSVDQIVEEIVQQILEAEMDETVGPKKVSAHPIGQDTGVDITPRRNLCAPPGRGRKAPDEYAGPADETGGHARPGNKSALRTTSTQSACCKSCDRQTSTRQSGRARPARY
jgi:hypothetical protein